MQIIPVTTRRQKRQFIDFPHDLYEGDPNYVPALYLDQKEVMNPKKNPFFKHSKADLFLAVRDGKIVGRIAAIRNNEYNRFANEQVGYFGFFDVIEDYKVAEALLNRVEAWVKAEGLQAIYGPTNFTTNETAGVLIEGYDSPPVVWMTYNKPYYADYLNRYGFGKRMDLFAYKVPTQSVSQRSLDVSARLEERLQKRGIIVRNVRMKDFKQEVQAIREIYKKAWEQNWGFVPPTEEEFDHLADGLKFIVDPEMVFVAEKEGETIGFFLGLPDINQIMIKQKRGRIIPFGIFRLLFGKKKVTILRIVLLGVLPDYRRSGIEAIFYAKIIRYAQTHNIAFGEGSWVLEDNEMMNKGMQGLNAEVYKKYRIYSYAIPNSKAT